MRSLSSLLLASSLGLGLVFLQACYSADPVATQYKNDKAAAGADQQSGNNNVGNNNNGSGDDNGGGGGDPVAGEAAFSSSGCVACHNGDGSLGGNLALTPYEILVEAESRAEHAALSWPDDGTLQSIAAYLETQ